MRKRFPLFFFFTLSSISALSQGAEIVPTPDDPISGDVDGNGVVDMDDYDIVDANQTMSGRVLWSDGDVNRDRVIDSTDLAIVTTNLTSTQPALPLASGVALYKTGGGLPSDGATTSLLDIFEDDSSSVATKIFRNRTLVQPSSWDPPSGPSELSPSIDATWRDDGVDLTVTYANTTMAPLHPATIQIPVFDRSMTPKFRNMAYGGMLDELSYNEFSNGSGSMLGYPQSLYAPATVIENHDAGYAVGISVQYPILEYKHPVFFFHNDVAGNGGMLVHISLNPWNDAATQNPYDEAFNVPAETTRIYLISIRVRAIDFVSADAGEWMHTLRPYRRWFRREYGGVRYERRAEQVRANSMAPNNLGDSLNPYSFRDAPTPRRPDVYGFGPWRTLLDSSVASGWERQMIWQPTGRYYTHISNNYPPQFTSEWPNILASVDPMLYDDSTDPLATFESDNSADDATLGLWWGRSSQIPTTDPWDPATLVTYDATQMKHVMFREGQLAGAEDVNASEIGLDTFSAGDQWERYWTLQDDIANHPGIRFITEPVAGDFVHTLTPTFEFATWNPDMHGGQVYQFPQGVPIMDFLLPGHEIWGELLPQDIQNDLGIGGFPSATQIKSYVEDVAGFGFVPCLSGAIPAEVSGTDYDAAETWESTVPYSLR